MRGITRAIATAWLVALSLAGCSSAGKVSLWSHAPVPSPTIPAPPSASPPGTPLPPTPTPGATPTPELAPVEVALPAVMGLPDRAIDLGDLGLSLTDIRSVALSPSEWAGGLPLDDHTIALASSGTRSADIGRWHVVGGSSTWIADLDTGVSRLIDAEAGIVDVSPDGTRLLLFGLEGSASRLHVLGRDGTRIASLGGMRSVPHAAFLDDGTVAVADASRIGVWDPDTGSMAWSDLPAGTSEPFVTAVGQRVVVDAGGRSALVDPRTGTAIGRTWHGGNPAAVAASPDRSRFAVGVHTPSGPFGRVELRDAVTGRILAVYPGRLLSTVDSIVWPTDEVVIVMRASTGTEQTAVPEMHLANDFEARPISAEPFMPQPHYVVQHGDLIAAFGVEGPMILLRATESRR